MSSDLYLRDTYINNFITHLFNSRIIEYDISKANISILLNENFISIEEYNNLYNLPKQQRAIKVGLMQKHNNDINIGLTNGFKKYRKLFFDNNNLNDNDILSIKKDAIYVIDKRCNNLSFGNVNFTEKNIYNLYFNYDKYEFYYLLDTMLDFDKLDIKGINDEKLKLHENGMLDFLKFIFGSILIDNVELTINFICNFMETYNNFQLSKEYYRQLDNNSLYVYKTNGFIEYSSMEYIDNLPLNISYNRNILIHLLKILSSDFLYRIK